MLTDYIREAMRVAHYEMMENGRFFATIPPLEGAPSSRSSPLPDNQEQLTDD
jgi:hypothetical protein